MAKIEPTALYKIGYGLYVITSKSGEKHNGMIVNSVMQIADEPKKIGVSINKKNYSHDIIKETKIMNVNCLSESAPFEIFENFGFKSGKEADKFLNVATEKSENGLYILKDNVNSFISLEVTDYLDMGSHGLFVADIKEAGILSDEESMTYAYYHKNVKIKKEPSGEKGYKCNICGYIYEGETLPEDFVCPWCKHGAECFEAM